MLADDARRASDRSSAHLVAGRREESLPEQEAVVAKLREIADLLPKPPRSPADRIRELIEKEKAVREEITGMPGINEDARRALERDLEGRQRGHGREAGAIAGELEGSPGEKEKSAGEKVRDAEREVFDSAEGLARARDEAAGDSTDRAITALDEALRILSGEKGEDDRQDRPDDRGDQGDDGDDGKKPEPQDVRRLDAAEARRMMEEMDRDRREEERKLFPGGGGMRVDKDW